MTSRLRETPRSTDGNGVASLRMVFPYLLQRVRECLILIRQLLCNVHSQINFP